MKKSLIVSLLSLGLVAMGCSSNNKAATADNSSSAQPASSSSAQPAASSDNSSAANTSSSSSNNSSSSASTGSNSNPDQHFITEAAKGNRAEVQLGKMMVSKATDPNVKKFAQMMVDDHTKALNELQQLAQNKNITLPDGLPDDAKDLQDKVSNESGKQLDKDYMDGMVQDHQKDVQEFQDASQNAQDKDVKQWATKMVPKLQQHLKKAQQIDSKVGGNAGNNSQGQ